MTVFNETPATETNGAAAEEKPASDKKEENSQSNPDDEKLFNEITRKQLRDEIGVIKTDETLSTPPKFYSFEYMSDRKLVEAEYISRTADDKKSQDKKDVKTKPDKKELDKRKTTLKNRRNDRDKKLAKCDTVKKVI
jgi:hypothetical protein